MLLSRIGTLFLCYAYPHIQVFLRRYNAHHFVKVYRTIIHLLNICGLQHLSDVISNKVNSIKGDILVV